MSGMVISTKVGGVWLQRGQPVPPPPPPPDPEDPVDPEPPVNGLPAKYTTSNQPWTVASGKSLLDNVPAGIPIYNASDYSTSTDLVTVLNAVSAGVPAAGYVRLDSKPRYYINKFQFYNGSTSSWVGWQNNLSGAGNRKVMGLIGNGVLNTSICVAPGAINATANLRNFVLATTKSIGPIPIIALVFTNSQSTIPLFFSGISFDGTLQGPNGVYNTSAQAQFNINQGVASPLAWRGLQTYGARSGSRLQYSRFQAFSYALLNAPPFECGAVETNYSSGFTYEFMELDGRVAADLDPARPYASGGVMYNKDIKVMTRNSWMHHTRRSGNATNTNTGRQDEVYSFDNFQQNNITTTDGFAGLTSTFPGSNVEAVVGKMVYTNCYTTVANQAHLQLSMPYSGSPGVYQLPARPIFYSTGFRTDDTRYGGCMTISVPKQPNSTGISAAWQKLTDSGIAGSGLFDIRDATGKALVGVKSTSFNASVHKPTTHYVVIY